MPETSFDRRTAAAAGRRGVTLLLASIMTTALVTAAGLAIDTSVQYAVKARLSAAVDAAALAGARSLNRGLDLDSQRASAEATAAAFLNANFPNGSWGSSNRTHHADVSQTGYRVRTVSVTASVDAPLYFMRIIGKSSMRIRADGSASRRDVNLVLVLDRSGSLAQAHADTTLRSCARAFVDKFAEGRDRLGMVSFSGTTRLDFAPSFQFKTANPSLPSTIGSMTCEGNTATAQGLWQGYRQIVNLNEPGALNVVLLFTDGRPTALAASYPVKTVADVRYDDDHTGTLANIPASGCGDAGNKTAYIASYVNTFAATGATFGAFQPAGTGEWSPAANSAGCSYAARSTSGEPPERSLKVRRDIAFIPALDLDGNSTGGYQTAVDRFPAGHPYAGQLRPDSPRTVRYAAYNAADNGAQRIRADTQLGTVVFAIGLGGTSSEPVDDIFLRRLANDPESPIFDDSKPAGLYVYSPTTAQLNDAFSRIASEILRLSL